MANKRKTSETMEDVTSGVMALRETIVQGWEWSRIPLILLGAKGTPLNINAYDCIDAALSSDKGKNYTGTRPPKYPKGTEPHQTRVEQAKLFGDLQNDKSVWGAFCVHFLVKWLDGLQSTTKETARGYYHGLRMLATLRETPPRHPLAVVMTTNFDGAFADYEEGSLSGSKCLMYISPTLVTRLSRSARTTTTIGEPGVMPRTPAPPAWGFVLRGDVYHTHCTNPTCPSFMLEVPAYVAVRNACHRSTTRFSADTPLLHEGIAREVLTCPECGAQMVLSISFPGLEKKEDDISQLMEAVWAVFGVKLSAIITVGFSGDSDRQAVRYLSAYAKRSNCHWFSVVPEKHPPASTAVQSAGQALLGDRFHICHFGQGAASLTALLPPVSKADSLRPLDNPQIQNLPNDGLWLTGDGTSSSPFGNFAQACQRGDLTFTLGMGSPTIPPLEHKLRTHYSDLGTPSQLALKAYWWQPTGSKPEGPDGQPTRFPKSHKRHNHAIGVSHVARCWLRLLAPKVIGWEASSIKPLADGQDLQRTSLLGNLRLSELESLLRAAALLHDVGHLPFSHLMEEVLNELHWTPSTEEPYSHEFLTAAIVRHQFSAQIKTITSGLVPAALAPDDGVTALTRLLRGGTGATWLDCILNSPLDADKIDYVFRDMRWLGVSGRLLDNWSWMGEFFSEQEVSDTGVIMLHGVSAVAAYRLLAERVHLYDSMYFAPRFRLMERMARYVLTRFLALRSAHSGPAHALATSAAIKNETPTGHNAIGMVIDSSEARKNLVNAIAALEHSDTGGQVAFATTMTDFIDMLSKATEGTSAGGAGLGIIKIGWVLTVLKETQDKDRGFAFLQALYNEPDGLKCKEATRQYAQYAETHLAQLRHVFEGKWEHVVTEVRYLGEIALWFLSRSQDTHDAKCREHYEVLSKICIRLIDPREDASVTQKDQPAKNGHRPPMLPAVRNGEWPDRMLVAHCIGDPFVVRPPASYRRAECQEVWLRGVKSKLEEVGRQLELEYPGRALLDVCGPIKVRTYASVRKIEPATGGRVVCEQFLVPDGDPRSWNAGSRASVPLAAVDFAAALPLAYQVRVLLIDPSEKTDCRPVVLDRFLRACRLNDIPVMVEGTNNDGESVGQR